MMRILLYCLPIIYRDNMYIIAKTNGRASRQGCSAIIIFSTYWDRGALPIFFNLLLIAIRADAFHHIVDVMERKALWNVHHRHTLVLKAIRFLALFAIEMHMLVGVMRTAAT